MVFAASLPGVAFIYDSTRLAWQNFGSGACFGRLAQRRCGVVWDEAFEGPKDEERKRHPHHDLEVGAKAGYEQSEEGDRKGTYNKGRFNKRRWLQ